MDIELPVTIERQPDYTTCGPTSLHALYGGFRSAGETASVADPLMDNPAHGSKYYRVGIHRLIGSIFLGATSDDANCLVIRPRIWQPPA